METPGEIDSKVDFYKEGKAVFDMATSGGNRGPGVRNGPFLNPAMVQNRDLSVLMLQVLISNDQLPGKEKNILDGLTGGGARVIRWALEVEGEVNLTASDIDPRSISLARKNSVLNNVEPELIIGNFKKLVLDRRFSYIDIDPFGSPVEFLDSGISGILDRGVFGITATDTAALSGSIPRVARRRYGIELGMTHMYQEISARSLMGHVARIAASREMGVEPLFFYTSDHFVRGYIRFRKGARRADASLSNLGWLSYEKGLMPEMIDGPEGIRESSGSVMGPLWHGKLEDPGLLESILEDMEKEGQCEYMGSFRETKNMLEKGKGESHLPPFGFDVNFLSSRLKVSPPSMDRIMSGLVDMGYRWSRTRFSPTIFKTDANNNDVISLFKMLGGG